MVERISEGRLRSDLERGHFVWRNIVDQRPEICGLWSESPLGTEYLDDLRFRKSLPKPSNGVGVAVFEDARHGIVREFGRVELVKVRIPE